MLAVQVGEDLGDLRSEHSEQRQLGLLEDDDLDAGASVPLPRSPARSSPLR